MLLGDAKHFLPRYHRPRLSDHTSKNRNPNAGAREAAPQGLMQGKTMYDLQTSSTVPHSSYVLSKIPTSQSYGSETCFRTSERSDNTQSLPRKLLARRLEPPRELKGQFQ
jgi:hypothetical protein